MSAPTMMVQPVQHDPAIPVLNGQVTRSSPHTIGCGAFSNLYSGFWDYRGNSYPVAIKVLRGVHHNEEEYRRVQTHLKRECTVWLRLNHPNILPFYGVDYTLDASPALISPLCSHGDIQNYFRNYPDTDRFKILVGVASGLEYLHGERVVHGDIKPQNILMNDRHVPVLCDFGRSRIIGQKGFTTRLAGLARYAAPELLTDDSENPSVTLATDLYTFAIVGAEILADRLAFTGADYHIARKVLRGERPQPYNVHGKGVHAWPILEKCWAAEPDRRMPMHVAAPRLRQL